MKILVSCENKQELFELTLILENLKKIKGDYELIFFDTSNIYSVDLFRNSSTKKKLFSKIYYSVNPYNQNFKKLSLVHKSLLLIRNSNLLSKIIEHEQIDVFLSGVPLSFFRFAHIVSHNKPIYISYIRSALFPRDIPHSISEKIYRFAKKIPLIKGLRVFNNWYSDVIITIGNMNKKYFIDRGFSPDKVIVAGSILLDYYKSKCLNSMDYVQGKKNDKPKEVYLLSTAFKWHNDIYAHKEQKKFIEDCIRIYSSDYRNKFKLIFRPHPRDDINDYINILEKYNIPIDLRDVDEFIGDFSPYNLLISALSTLNLEWRYLGGKTIFFSTNYIYEKYGSFYELLNLKPLFSLYEVFNFIEIGKDSDIVLNDIFYMHDTNSAVFAAEKIIELAERG